MGFGGDRKIYWLILPDEMKGVSSFKFLKERLAVSRIIFMRGVRYAIRY